MCSLCYMLVNTNSVRYSAFCVMTSQQRDTGDISSSESLPDVTQPLSSPSQVKRPRLNETNEDPAAVVDAMSLENQQAVLLTMEEDDPTVSGDVATGEAAENEPEDTPDDAQGANEDDSGVMDQSTSASAANTSSAPATTDGAGRKKKQPWVRSAFTWNMERAYKINWKEGEFPMENFRYLKGRHYARDGTPTTRWDMHFYALKRYLYEGAPICGLDKNAPECDYCPLMKPETRDARVEEAKAFRKKPTTIGKPSIWQKLPKKIMTIADCRREVEATGYMYEYFEHKSVNSNFAQRPINIKAVEVAIQTDMSMLHKGPHPTDPNKEIIYDKIPPITEHRRVWDPNLVCERFIHPEARNIYNNRVQFDHDHDPARFELNPRIYLGFKLLHQRMHDDYFPLMTIRNKQARAAMKANAMATLKKELRQDHDLQQFKQTYLGGVFPKDTIRYNLILGDGIGDDMNDKTGLDEEHDGSHLLPNFYKYRKNMDILKCTIDGQRFAPTEYSTEVLLEYHERWAVFYRKKALSERAEISLREEEMTDPDVVAEMATIAAAKRQQEAIGTVQTAPVQPTGQQQSQAAASNVQVKQETTDGAGAEIKQEPEDGGYEISTENQNKQQEDNDDDTDSDATIDTDNVTHQEEQQTEATEHQKAIVKTEEGTQLQTMTVATQQIPPEMLFPAPAPTPDEMTVANLVLKAALYMLEKTPVGKRVTEARNNQRLPATMDEQLRQLPMYLKWEYNEKHHQLLSLLKISGSTATPLKLQQAAHKLYKPEFVRRKPADAAVQISPEVWALIDARLARLRRHIMTQTVNDYQDLDVFTDGLNAGAYTAEGSELPILAGELTDGAVTWARANLAAEHKSRFTIRDIAITEQYIRLLVNVLNALNLVTAELHKLWRVDSEEARDACDLLLDSLRSLETDARQAVCETLVHIIVTRRQRSMRSALNFSKSTVAGILTAPLGDSVSLY